MYAHAKDSELIYWYDHIHMARHVHCAVRLKWTGLCKREFRDAYNNNVEPIKKEVGLATAFRVSGCGHLQLDAA